MTTQYRERSDERWLELSEKLVAISKKMGELKQEYQELREEMIALADGDSCKGGGVRLLRTKRKGTIDYSKIPELESVELERYRKPPTESWNLAIVTQS